MAPTPQLLIVSPLFPPARGGLPDHTAHLAEALRSAGADVAVLTTRGPVADTSVPVYPDVADWQQPAEILAAIAARAGQRTVLWQYVPHMYGRGGVNLGLPRVLATLRRQRRTQLVLAHEIAAPLSLWPQRCAFALAHRWQWRRMLASADAVGISTEAWLGCAPQNSVRHRPKTFLAASPANIARRSVAADHASAWRQSVGVPATARVLAYFGTPGGAKQFDWVLAAWRQAQAPDRPVALVVIGEPPATIVPPELQALYLPLGYLPADQVSAALQGIDVLALPFVDGVSERRGSFMSGLSHGCAIVTTLGHSTGPALGRADFFRAVAEGQSDAFRQAVAALLNDQPAGRQLGERARLAYDNNYGWPRLAERLLGRLAGPRNYETSRRSETAAK